MSLQVRYIITCQKIHETASSLVTSYILQSDREAYVCLMIWLLCMRLLSGVLTVKTVIGREYNVKTLWTSLLWRWQLKENVMFEVCLEILYVRWIWFWAYMLLYQTAQNFGRSSTSNLYVINISQCCMTFFEQNHWAVFFDCQLYNC
jgi:hypothetical protein